VEIYARNVEDASGMKLGVAFYLFFWLAGGFVIAFIGFNQIFWVWLIAVPVMWGTVAMGYWTSYKTVLERQKSYAVASAISEEAFDGIKTVIAFNK